jgi:hypothetical protein
MHCGQNSPARGMVSPSFGGVTMSSSNPLATLDVDSLAPLRSGARNDACLNRCANPAMPNLRLRLGPQYGLRLAVPKLELACP